MHLCTFNTLVMEWHGLLMPCILHFNRIWHLITLGMKYKHSDSMLIHTWIHFYTHPLRCKGWAWGMMSAPEEIKNWNGEAIPWKFEPHKGDRRKVTNPISWDTTRVVKRPISLDRSADTMISGRYGSEQRGPIILPCCDSKCHPQCSACWEMGVSLHGLTGTV